ncbi:hypothetical protein PpBr36_01378 [Pyricularia pennisetigena]|uniref:hypothetical protein n=1 Tax=Pyricularia pennisetigena TaxID=1578925 RepID=UPI0011520C1F|nr:hypothetical protein PpBr36_01378 [Pyricularia pennisetigena]TLS28428.1 hypothetical protein PpBr36_01378 [Pyricularia pennisetigena]
MYGQDLPVRLTVPVVGEAEARATAIQAAVGGRDALKDGRAAASAVGAGGEALTTPRGVPLDANAMVIAGLTA